MDFVRIGHRGAPYHAVENTVESFQKAMKFGCDMVETDVRLTKDGELVCSHDNNLKRLGGTRAKIRNLTLNQLKSSSLKQGSKIATLSEVLSILKPHFPINIEIKEHGFEEKLLEMISRKSLHNHVILSSFSKQVLKKIRSIDSKVKLGMLFHPWQKFDLNAAKSLGCYSVHPNVLRVKKRLVKRAHAEGFKVFPYTVNTEARMRRLIHIGVDGFFTNDLITLNSVLKEHISRKH